MKHDSQTERLKILTHSQHMVLAAQEGQWDELDTLLSSWPDLLDEGFEHLGESMKSLQAQLLHDNQQIQKAVKQAQFSLNQSFRQDASQIHSLQAYLK